MLWSEGSNKFNENQTKLLYFKDRTTIEKDQQQSLHSVWPVKHSRHGARPTTTVQQGGSKNEFCKICFDVEKDSEESLNADRTLQQVFCPTDFGIPKVAKKSAYCASTQKLITNVPTKDHDAKVEAPA